MLGKVTATMLVSSTISEHGDAVSKVSCLLTLGLTDMARVLYC
jgi:hypothetical protein